MSKKHSDPETDVQVSDRRNFLRRAMVATGATTAAAAAVGVGAHQSIEHTASTAPEDAKSKGYRETDHVREYYRLARI